MPRAARTAPYNLTEKQYRFVQAFLVNHGVASQAYREAYDAERMTEGSIRVRASQLLDDPNINVALTTLRAQTAQKHAITVDTLIEELEQARALALANCQAGAAAAATMGKAKLLGLVVERANLKVEDAAPSEPARVKVAQLFAVK